jgi:F0F1-type ATP synthase membrane subunit b/b'
MAAVSRFTRELGGEVEGSTEDGGAPARAQLPGRATPTARAALVSASLKARAIQQTAQSVLVEARAEGDAIVASARASASTLLTNARSQADTVTALARRDADTMVSLARLDAESALAEAQAEVASVLGAARRDAELLLANARAEAERLHQRSTDAARQDAEEIVDRALVHRELLLSATLQRIATLTSRLIAMSEQLVSHAEDPAVARAQLAHLMLVLTETAEQVGAEDPEG